jgi:sodium-dependent dicarboxylate transporter 2/3/5
MLGMMFVTWFLSLWISNTASTAMMLPIAIVTCKQVSKLDQNSTKKSDVFVLSDKSL